MGVPRVDFQPRADLRGAHALVSLEQLEQVPFPFQVQRRRPASDPAQDHLGVLRTAQLGQRLAQQIDHQADIAIAVSGHQTQQQITRV